MINSERENKQKYKQEILKRFGRLITRLRKSIGLTSVELAHRSDFEPSNMTRIEKGRSNPTLMSLIRIAKALGLTLRKMMRGFDEQKHH